MCNLKNILTLSVASLLSLPSFAQNYAGYPDGALCVYANAARYNPNAFVQTVGAVNSCSSPGNLGPLCPNDGLTAAAHAHTADMIQNNFFSHDSSSAMCAVYNGCGFANRVNYYFPGGNLAENIDAGFHTPGTIIGGWMSSPDHCNNLKGDYDCVGHGMGTSNDEYGTYCTEDLGQCGCTGPIICGGDISSSTGITFVVAVYTTTAYDTVVVIAGSSQKRYTMTAEISGGNGRTFQVVVTDLDVSQCNAYTFEVLNGGSVVDSYPKQGSFQTEGSGNCGSNTISGSQGQNTVVAQSPSSTTPTTTASTQKAPSEDDISLQNLPNLNPPSLTVNPIHPLKETFHLDNGEITEIITYY